MEQSADAAEAVCVLSSRDVAEEPVFPKSRSRQGRMNRVAKTDRKTNTVASHQFLPGRTIKAASVHIYLNLIADH
jgi:hypothetical protein